MMAETIDPQRTVEQYLHDLRSGLRGMPSQEVSEIVEEIRSHIRDFASTGGELSPAEVRETLERLGPARVLAARYTMQGMAIRAQGSGSHFLALKTIFRWAKLSFAGFVAFIVSLIGYGVAAVFAYTALAKPFLPNRVGLWRLHDPSDWSFSLGVVDQPGARELLGWWIIPIGLALACGSFFLTQRFVMWSIRRLRSAQPFPTAKLTGNLNASHDND